MSDGASFSRSTTVDICPVCDSRQRRELYRVGEWLYGLPGSFPEVLCLGCGLVYLSERPDLLDLHRYYPEDTYYSYRAPVRHSLFTRADALASAWYFVKRSVLAHQYGYRHLGGSRLVSEIVRLPMLSVVHRKATFNLEVLLHPWVPDGSLLEVGCGAGMYLDLMRALGWKRVAGVDFSEKAIRQAREVLDLEGYCGEMENARLADQSFDAVSLSHTLEHVSKPVALLNEIRRVMKPGARLAVIVPNVESLCARIYQTCWVGLDPPRHLLNFTRRSLLLALVRAGLVVERLSTTPRGAFGTAIFSHSRRAGDPRSTYTDSTHRFPLARRGRALTLAFREHVECALGMPAGEELVAIARRPLQ